MGELDGERIRQLIGMINDSLHRLNELGNLCEKDFLSDFRNTESAKYLLIKATEAAIDICNHIVAKKGGRAPKDYADCFAILKELGVIGDNLTERLARMARFRNLIVHLYWEVNDEKVFEIIKRNLTDLEEFQQVIASYVTQESS